MKKQKIGYAFGVGGARGFCHLGVLEVLEENGIKPDYIAGASMGSLIGGLYALGCSLSEIRRVITKMKKSDVLDISIFFMARPGVSKDKRFVNCIQEFAEDKKIEDCVIPYKAVAADLVSGKEYIFDRGVIWQAIRASSSIPGVFSPVEIDGRILVDGGLLNRVPAGIARDMGADIVIGIDAMGDFLEGFTPGSPISVIRRAFDVVDKLIFDGRRNDADILITPSQDGLDAMDFSKKSKSTAIDAGRAAAYANIDAIKKLINNQN